MDITFNCDKCGQNIVIDEKGAGITTTCPKCGTEIVVPSSRSPKENALDSNNNHRFCTLCREPVRPEATVCCHCGSNLIIGVSAVPQVEGLVETKYKALRSFASLFKMLAVGSLIVGFLIAVIMLNNFQNVPGGWLLAISCLLSGGISAAVLWAGAKSIMVFIDTEENTRATTILLRMIAIRQHREPISPLQLEAPRTTNTGSGQRHVRFS